jgi:hypothetical protein
LKGSTAITRDDVRNLDQYVKDIPTELVLNVDEALIGNGMDGWLGLHDSLR